MILHHIRSYLITWQNVTCCFGFSFYLFTHPLYDSQNPGRQVHRMSSNSEWPIGNKVNPMSETIPKITVYMGTMPTIPVLSHLSCQVGLEGWQEPRVLRAPWDVWTNSAQVGCGAPKIMPLESYNWNCTPKQVLEVGSSFQRKWK